MHLDQHAEAESIKRIHSRKPSFRDRLSEGCDFVETRALRITPQLRQLSVPSKFSENLVQSIRNWDFNVFEILDTSPERPLVFLGYALFSNSTLLTDFDINEQVLCAFLQEVDEGYPDNPYHNKLHGCDVAQTMYYFINQSNIYSSLEAWQRLSAITAALVHDLGHFGYMNPFLLKTNHELAIRYHYKSPLESMHLAKAFHILAKPKCNFLSSVVQKDVDAIRGLMTEMILATDNSAHQTNLTEFQIMVEQGAVDMGNEGNVDKVLMMTLHAADISNPAKEWTYYNKWSDLILDEFQAQGDYERAKGMPISPLCDRDKMKTIKDKAFGQMFFIHLLVQPVYEALSEFHDALSGSNGPPNNCFIEAMKHIHSNFSKWKDISETEPIDTVAEDLSRISVIVEEDEGRASSEQELRTE
uniref:PDEase domain-containing protein n=1 Tax=Octactis speculum TaxID=3111310 RepID=A0A7S2G8J2_9STRA